MDKQFSDLTKKLDYTFKDETLLKTALTHRSAAKLHNERLEFLGDSLLNYIIASELFKRFPNAKEGELSRLRSLLVKGETLADLAKQFSLGHHIQLGSGELKSGGFARNSILADAMEAIVGAMYLDGGIDICYQCVVNWYENRLNSASVHGTKDPKTRLQEYLQGKRLPLPEYLVKNIEGKSHAQIFYVECRVDGLSHVVESTGKSRRQAEQEAAKKYLELLIDKPL